MFRAISFIRLQGELDSLACTRSGDFTGNYHWSAVKAKIVMKKKTFKWRRKVRGKTQSNPLASGGNVAAFSVPCLAEARIGSNSTSNDEIDLRGTATVLGGGVPWDPTNTFDSGSVPVTFDADLSTGKATWTVGAMTPISTTFPTATSIRHVDVIAGVQNYASVAWSGLQVTFSYAGGADSGTLSYNPAVDDTDLDTASPPDEQAIAIFPATDQAYTAVTLTGNIRMKYDPSVIGTPDINDLYAQIALFS